MPTADERWMLEALRIATSRGDTPGTAPIGAVLVMNGKIVGSAHNECQTLHDATAHAEMIAFRRLRVCTQTFLMSMPGSVAI